ncbi:transposase [Actinophytocola gossypii]|uniref:transposase n=1 Tax=Actinophytocola gossypii TaxID=2812003 RepID=UPI0021A29FFE|nr:transposase [Actinophytocola gossypii]
MRRLRVLVVLRRAASVERDRPDPLLDLSDETYRRRIARQLNKGENPHALRRSLAYAGEGAVRRRHHEQQTEQMRCLTVATNAIVCWLTEYHGLGVAALRLDGRDIDDEVLAHIWATPPRECALLPHPLRRHRRRTRPTRRRRLPTASAAAGRPSPPAGSGSFATAIGNPP